MTKRGIISIDLATVVGTLKFLPGHAVPRHNKPLLEQSVALALLRNLAPHEGVSFANVQSNPQDPPDVTFLYGGHTRGMELVEILPPNRLGKDAIIRQLRRKILSQLDLGPSTKNHVVNIFLKDDYAEKLRPGRMDRLLANVLNRFFSEPEHTGMFIPIPDDLQSLVTKVSVFNENLTDDPRVGEDNEPLIMFGAQNTQIIPDKDCPKMVAERLDRKRLHDIGVATWLLIWSNHHALFPVREELNAAIRQYVADNTMNYERIFHLFLFSEGGVTEFPSHRDKPGV